MNRPTVTLASLGVLTDDALLTAYGDFLRLRVLTLYSYKVMSSPLMADAFAAWRARDIVECATFAAEWSRRGYDLPQPAADGGAP